MRNVWTSLHHQAPCLGSFGHARSPLIIVRFLGRVLDRPACPSQRRHFSIRSFFANSHSSTWILPAWEGNIIKPSALPPSQRSRASTATPFDPLRAGFWEDFREWHHKATEGEDGDELDGPPFDPRISPKLKLTRSSDEEYPLSLGIDCYDTNMANG